MFGLEDFIIVFVSLEPNPPEGISESGFTCLAGPFLLDSN